MIVKLSVPLYKAVEHSPEAISAAIMKMAELLGAKAISRMDNVSATAVEYTFHGCTNTEVKPELLAITA